MSTLKWCGSFSKDFQSQILGIRIILPVKTPASEKFYLQKKVEVSLFRVKSICFVIMERMIRLGSQPIISFQVEETEEMLLNQLCPHFM